MSQTLSNGYRLPEDGDRGSSWFSDLESNIQRVNDHNHNGANSEKLTAEAVVALTDTINPVDWAVQANGLYRASVVMPLSLEFDTTSIGLRSNNKPIYGDIEKLTSNSFYVYVNDNSLTVTVVYG